MTQTAAPTGHLPDPWPAPLASGPVRATVSLPGSKSLTNRALVLTVQAVNDPPTLDVLNNVALEEDAPLSLPLTGVSAGAAYCQSRSP